MVKQIINVGTTANDRTGDPLRIAFQKTNNNFTEVYNSIGTLETAVQELSADTGNVFSSVELTGRYTLGPSVNFTKVLGVTEVDFIDTGLSLTRSISDNGVGGGGLYNPLAENAWNANVSPTGLLWNWDGWANLDNVKSRQYVNLRQALKNKVGANIVGAELVAHDTINNKYYTFFFTQWDVGAQHDGTFAYTRRLIQTTAQVGITFADGTNLVSAPKKFYGYPQTYVGDTSDYTLVIEDAGKHVYADGVTITVPRHTTVDFPIGSIVRVVAEDEIVKVASTFGVSISSANATQDVNGNWIIPKSSIATLIKTRQGNGETSDIWRLDAATNKEWNYIEDVEAGRVKGSFNVVDWNSGKRLTIEATPFETTPAVTYNSAENSEYIYFVWDQNFIDNVWQGLNTPQGEGQSYSISLDDGATWIPVETSGYNGGTFFYFWIPTEFRQTYSFTYSQGQSATIRYNRGSLAEVWFDLADAPFPADQIFAVNMSVSVNAKIGDLQMKSVWPTYRFANVLYDDNTGQGDVNTGANVWSGSQVVENAVQTDIRRIDDPLDAGRIYARFNNGLVGTMDFYWNAKLFTFTETVIG